MDLLNEKQNLAFIGSAVKRAGCWYCWPTRENRYSGKDLRDAEFPNTYDCSGLVTASLYESSGTKIDWRATVNAQGLLERCGVVSKPQEGDLCFYGPSRGLVGHVMVWVGDAGKKHGGPCFGASGGDSTTLSVRAAQARDAKVRGYKTHLYRNDFLCFGRLVE